MAAGDLDGELVALASAAAERYAGIVHRQDAAEPLGITNGDVVGVAGVERGELEPLRLLRHAPGDFLAPVPDVAGAEMVAGIEQPPSRVVEDVRAFSAHDDARIDARILLFEAREIGQEVPQASLCAGRRLAGRARSSIFFSMPHQTLITNGSWGLSLRSHQTLLVCRY